MDKKPQERDLRRHFEAILGHELEDIFEGEIALRERIAVWSEKYDNGHITSREIGTTGQSTKACGNAGVFFIGGQTVTGSDGKVEFLLSDYHCFFARETGSSNIATFPIIFVATPQSREPVFVTTRTTAVFKGGSFTDVKIEIYTWDHSGAPAKTKSVDWFCQLPFLSIIS
jgi:hypothetical protein